MAELLRLLLEQVRGDPFSDQSDSANRYLALQLCKTGA